MTGLEAHTDACQESTTAATTSLLKHFLVILLALFAVPVLGAAVRTRTIVRL